MNEISILMAFSRAASIWLVWLTIAVLHLFFAVLGLLWLWLSGSAPDAVAQLLHPTSPQTLSVALASIAGYGYLVKNLSALAHRMIRAHLQGAL